MINDQKDKAVLVVSFGTLHKETCDKTIGAIEETLAKAFPERKLYRAWTSNFIIQKLRKQYGIQCDTLEEALERMAADGITDVLVQPTHLLDGFENERMKQVIDGFMQKASDDASPSSFEQIAIGANLLSSEEDIERVSEIIIDDIYSKYCKDDHTALVLMGHGNRHDASSNTVYRDLQSAIKSKGFGNIFIGTVEGEPAFEEVLTALKERRCEPGHERGCITKAFVTPLMIVAGNHALNDMAGDGEDSWVNMIRSAGIEAEPIIKGLGEYESIRNIFKEHAYAAK